MADPLQPLKDGSKMLWSLGDYRLTAGVLEPEAQALVARAGMRPGLAVLDVAAGNGNFAIAAARAGARVVATDLTPRMVEWGRERSAADGLAMEWLEADAEALPFEDGRFDVVGSTFGAQFAPRPDVVARELFRVIKPGGLVAMANWTAAGFSGKLSALTTSYAPPAPMALPSAMEWGDPDEVRRRFLGLASSVEVERRAARFAFASTKAGQEFFEHTNPALLVLSRMLPAERYAKLLEGARGLVEQGCRPVDGGVVLDNEYLVVLARKTLTESAPGP
ncbi:MAG TPA: methyltransferase domain-containing protein [Candidatus Dormibacteraeota bacterium]|jgi:ubiquinone/menaquinone biosynthesis C-methylase UbiE